VVALLRIAVCCSLHFRPRLALLAVALLVCAAGTAEAARDIAAPVIGARAPSMLDRPASSRHNSVYDPLAFTLDATAPIRHLAGIVSGTITIDGDATTVTMGAGDDANVTFTGTAGQHLGLGMSNVTIGTSTCCSAFVSVTGPSGTLMSPSAFGTNGGQRNIPTLPADGTYTIVIDPQGTDSGSVTLTLSTDVANSISVGGSTSSVTVNRAGGNARVTFSGTQGEHLGLELSNVTLGTSACCGSNVSILKSDDSLFYLGRAVGTDGGNMNIPALPADGTYTIFIDPTISSTGSVTLTLSDDVTDSITIDGATTTVTMSRIGQNSRVSFNGTAGQYLGLAMSNVTLGTSSSSSGNVSILKNDDTLFYLGRSVGTNGGTMNIPVLPYTGSYTIFIDPATAATGAVTLTLSEDVASTVTIGGPPTTVNIGRIGQNARITFTGTQGLPLQAVLSNVSIGTSTFGSAFLSVLNPDTTTLKNPEPFGTDGKTMTFPTLVATGTHTIFIDPYQDDLSTGSVTLKLTQLAYESATRTYGVCGFRGTHALSAATCLLDPVNSLTGAFTSSASDLSLASKGVSFELTRSYTSADATVGRFGAGWTDSYATSLAIQQNGDVLLHGDEGQQVAYAKQADGSFVGDAGALSTLTSITGGYKLVTHDQVTYTFNSSGVLQSRVDRNGQGLTFGYDGSGRLSTVTDASGHTVTFSYSGSSPLVNSVGSTAQNTVAYGYTGGLLTSVTMPDPDGPGPLGQPVTHYGYDGGGRLATIVDPDNHTQVTNVYDPTSGRVTQQTDANNKTTNFSWDAATQTATATDANSHVWKDVYANGVLLKRIDPAGETTVFEHDSGLDVSAVTSPDGSSKTTMTYDSAGNLLTATAPASLGSAQKTFTYDAQNNVKSVTDARQKETDYGYDASGNLTSVTLDGQPVAGAIYNAQGQVLTSTDGNGKTTTYTYDANGSLASVTAPDPDGNGTLEAAKTTYTYGAMGNVLTRVDPLGNCSGCTPANYRTTYTYDAEGHLLTETDPLGNVTTHTYDLAGNETSVEDANHHVTTYEYDNANHLTKITAPDPDGAGAQTSPITTYTYDDVGNRISEVSPRGNVPGGNPASFTTTYAYDNNNRLVSVTTPKGEKTTYTYDANGNRNSMIDPRGYVQGANPDDYKTTYTYDAAGRLLTTTDPLSHVTTNHYDAVGNLDWTKDANDHQTNYSYDAAGRILTVQAPDGGLTTYTYDGNGNLKTRKDDNNHITTYTYDDASRLTQITGQDPDGAGSATSPVSTYTYDVNGNRLTMIDPNGNATQTAGDGKTTYTYDRGNRLKTIAYSDSTPGVTYNYDPVGNRSSMVDGSGTVTYMYDTNDRLLSVARGTNTFSYTYDPNGNVLTRTYPDTTQITYGYDEDDRLATVANGGNTTSYTYDAASNLWQTTLPSGNGYVETRTYDRAGRLTEVKNAKGASVLSDYVSTLDAVGNPTTIQDGSNTTNYAYDNNDRITAACYQAACASATDFIKWSYDKVGNRLTEQRPAGNTNYTYNGLDQLTQAGATAYTYDQNGNEKSAGTRTFTYDLANRLKTTISGSTTTTYTYDGDGARLQASTGTQASKKTNFLWDTNRDLPQLALERDGNNALLRRHIYGERRISMRSGTNDYYYHYDVLGSVRNITSATGVKQWTDVYEPFGAIRTETQDATGAPTNFVKFAGEYLDPTGLYYLRARQYDPVTGRFTRTDPGLGKSRDPAQSTYAYGDNQPTVMVDPSGATYEAASDGPDRAWLVASPGNVGPDCAKINPDDPCRRPSPKPPIDAGSRLSSSQLHNARIVYRLGLGARLVSKRAREMVAAAFMESSLKAGNVNHMSGAAGLFQLLSAGYVRRAKALGGLLDPRANTCAILPDYASYWRRHPNAAPGEGAAVVEASGESASFYAQPLKWLPVAFAPVSVAPCPG
jgi:RHS repeat-associated protein